MKALIAITILGCLTGTDALALDYTIFRRSVHVEDRQDDNLVEEYEHERAKLATHTSSYKNLAWMSGCHLNATDMTQLRAVNDSVQALPDGYDFASMRDSRRLNGVFILANSLVTDLYKSGESSESARCKKERDLTIRSLVALAKNFYIIGERIRKDADGETEAGFRELMKSGPILTQTASDDMPIVPMAPPMGAVEHVLPRYPTLGPLLPMPYHAHPLGPALNDEATDASH